MAVHHVYIVMYAEPWGVMARSRDSHVCLMMYKGTFTLDEFASKLLPLAKGDDIMFPNDALTDLPFAWNGMATWCRLMCVSVSCCVLVQVNL